MTAVKKQDSNFTELRYAVETSPGVVDGSVSWLALEPNSYKGFGADVKTKQRMPINSTRQLKKGVVVDLDATGGFQQDLTQTNFEDLSQCYLFAALRKKDELAVAVVDGTANAYQPASGGIPYFARDLLFAKSFANSANNGLKKVTGFPSAANIAVTDTGLLDESGAAAIISRVGFEFASAQVQIDVSNPLPRLTASGQVKATGTLTTTGVFSDGETVTIGGKVYTLQSVLTNIDGHVLIAGTTAATLTNLKNAINRDGTGVAGTDFATATVVNPYVTATSDATHLFLTAKVTGDVGNAITTTKVCTNASFGGATLASGAGARGLDSFGLIPGEFIFIGDDGAGTAFANAVDNGFVRVRTINSAYLEFDKTQSIMVTDNGAAKTIRVFFGRVVKNEADKNLIIKRSVQLERTLGYTDDATPTQIQAEYLTRSLADKMKLDCKTADIVRMELDFLCNTNELRAGSTGVKAGTRPSLKDSDAFNATSDVALTKMAIVTTGNACPSALFGYFTDLVIDLSNNLKQNKAVSVLGAFDTTAGFFQVTGTVTAYFTDIASMQAVKDNKSVTIETHFVKFNQGITFDLPLVVMSKAMADVKLNEPIMIPLVSDASTAKTIDANLDYTLLMVFWDYLPTLAG